MAEGELGGDGGLLLPGHQMEVGRRRMKKNIGMSNVAEEEKRGTLERIADFANWRSLSE